jgi:hypothetical protein
MAVTARLAIRARGLAERARGRLVGEQRGGGAVAELGRVPRGHRAVGTKRRPQARQALGGVGADALVAGEHGLAVGVGDRHGLGIELARVPGPGGAARRWLATAYASCSVRSMPARSASSSAPSPSAIVHSAGMRVHQPPAERRRHELDIAPLIRPVALG